MSKKTGWLWVVVQKVCVDVLGLWREVKLSTARANVVCQGRFGPDESWRSKMTVTIVAWGDAHQTGD